MERKINKVTLRGYVAIEPRVRWTEQGSKYVIFILATWGSPCRMEESKTSFIQWLKVIAWGQVASSVQRMLYKGCQISLEGRLYWSSKGCCDGMLQARSEIVLDQFELEIRDWGKTGIRA